MNQNIECPVCLNSIQPDRIIDDLVICNCGWHHSVKGKATDQRNEYTLSALFIIFGVLLSLGFYHVSQWGPYSKEVLPLKWKLLSGQSQAIDLIKMHKMCIEIKNFNCQEQLLIQLNEEFQDIEALKKLGHLYFSNKMYHAAAHSLTAYFQEGGSHKFARYDLARTFGKLGEFQKSKVHFEKILKEKPNTLQITVTKAYVHMLIENKKFKAATHIIAQHRRRGIGIEHFLATEMKQANQYLKASRSTSSVKL